MFAFQRPSAAGSLLVRSHENPTDSTLAGGRPVAAYGAKNPIAPAWRPVQRDTVDLRSTSWTAEVGLTAKAASSMASSSGLDGLENEACRDAGLGDECSVRCSTHRLDSGVGPLGHEALAVGRDGVVLF